MISIIGLNKADVLAALYNASRPQGMGFMHHDPAPMAREEAQKYLDSGSYFDYLKGRVMKLNLSSDTEFEERLYDRDNGGGAAERVIVALRASGETNPPEAQAAHTVGIQTAAQLARKAATQKTTFDGETMRLGAADKADILISAIEKAERGE